MTPANPSDEEISKVLNDTDIEILRKRFLCSLKDIDNNVNNSYDFNQVYYAMGLGGYNLPLAMCVVIREYLLPQDLITMEGERVRITDRVDTDAISSDILMM
jgi:hypothetical protein